MKTKNHLASVAAIMFTATACNQAPKETEVKAEPVQTEEKVMEAPAEKAMNTDSLVAVINQKRTEIEQNLGEPMVVSTQELREKIKQKWEKIHFYTKDGAVVRIKTYPYSSISKRTEEFYLDNVQLILAVTEDNGDGEKGKEVAAIDKLYYYNNNQMIHEVKANDEAEYGIKNSDAEEQLQELNEYLDIYKASK